MKILYTAVFIFLISLTSESFLYSQCILQGVVTDSVSSQGLVGATIFLEKTSLGSATDLNGNYRIVGIPDGNYTVRISYIGYKSKYIQVKAEKNKSKVINVRLSPEVIKGKEVVVTAQALGQTAAINQQLSSNTIVNVVSEEKIQQLPDANAAESIGRLPGVALIRSGGEATEIVLRGMSPQFSKITIDGTEVAPTNEDDRGVDLSTISQGSLGGIELFKALTSDKDADAIAGSINLITPKAPTKRLLWVESKGSFNKLDNSLNQYVFNLRYGERFFNDVLGIQVSGNLEQRIRSNEQDALTYDQTLSNGNDYQLTNFVLNYTNEIRKRGGISLLLDINTPDNGSIKINNIFNRTSRNYIEYGRNYPDPTSISSNPFAYNVSYNARDVKQNIDTFNSFITGTNYLFNLNIDWGLSTAQSMLNNPFDYEMDFTEPTNGDTSGMSTIPTSLRHGPPESLIKYALNNFNVAYLYDAYNRFEENFTRENSAHIDILKKYSLNDGISGEIKVGAKYKNTNRTKTASEYISPYYLSSPLTYKYTRLPNGSIVPKDYNGTLFANIAQNNGSVLDFLDAIPKGRSIYGLYNLFPLLNRNAVEQWYNLNINGVTNADGSGSEYSPNDAVQADNYDVTERISAAYIMNTLNAGTKITFITGLRVENENNIYKSMYSPVTLAGFPSPVGKLIDTSSVHQETVWLPNFQLLYKPLDFMNIRLAAYRALSRPDFNKRLAFYVMRQGGAFYTGNSLEVGNPDLKDAKAWNFEINTSFYGNYIGLFSVSAFYKVINDMFHTINGVQISSANGQQVLDSLGIKVQNPFNTDFYLTYQSNSDKPTKVWGFEVEHQINFWYLPGLLQGLVLNYNFSIIRSETYLTSSTLVPYYVQIGPIKILNYKHVLVDIKQNLEGSPNFIGNIALGYDIGDFSIRLSLFHQSQSNSTFSADGRSDIIIDPFTRLDLILKQEISKHISVTLNVDNLTNVQEGTSILNRITGWQLLYTSQRYGLTGDLGVRISL